MDENEEFEFRARAEKEAKLKASAAPAPEAPKTGVMGAIDRGADKFSKMFEGDGIGSKVDKVMSAVTMMPTQNEIREKGLKGALIGKDEKKDSLGDAAKNVGGATGVSAAGGVAAPYIMKMVGGVLTKVPNPIAKAVGAAAILGGDALAAVPASWRAASGAGVGAASSTAGEIANQAGIGGTARKVVEMAAGSGSQALLHAAATGLSIGSAKVWRALVAERQDVKAEITRATKAALEQVRASGKSPQEAQKAANAITAGAKATLAKLRARQDAAAQAIQQQGEKEKAEIAETRKQVAKVAGETTAQYQTRLQAMDNELKANQGTINAHERAGDTTAVHVLDKAGLPAPTTSGDMGTRMSKQLVAQQAQQKAKASAAYEEGMKLANTQADNKAARGEFFINSKQGSSFVNKWTKATEADAKGTHPNPTSAKAITDVVKRLQNGGKPLSVEAILEERRRIGAAAFPKFGQPPAEGYAAIDQKQAKALYKDLTDAVHGYTPALAGHDAEYAEFKEASSAYKTPRGKLAERIEQGMAEPAKLAGRYLDGAQGYEQLVEHLGGTQAAKKAAERFAEQHVSNELHNQAAGPMTAKQADAFLRANREWVSKVPGLEAKVSAYAKQTRAIEAAHSAAQDKVKELERAVPQVQSKIAQTQLQAHKANMDLNKDAASLEASIKHRTDAQAAKTDKLAADLGKRILDQHNPSEKIGKMLTSDRGASMLKHVSKYILASPEGKEAFAGAVRQTLANESNPKAVVAMWQERIGPTLKGSPLMTEETWQKLNSDIMKLQGTMDSPQKVKLLTRMITDAVNAGVSNTAVQSVTSATQGQQQ